MIHIRSVVRMCPIRDDAPWRAYRIPVDAQDELVARENRKRRAACFTIMPSVDPRPRIFNNDPYAENEPECSATADGAGRAQRASPPFDQDLFGIVSAFVVCHVGNVEQTI
jgi:hypothetical protein